LAENEEGHLLRGFKNHLAEYHFKLSYKRIF